ncbi:MAG: ammonium transporter [Planctomycetota bacterium]
MAAFTANNLWLLVATILVFVMHLGFACLETGLTRAKNAVNILFKNIAIVALGTLSYALMGFSLMYGNDLGGGWFAWSGFGVGATDAQQGVGYAAGAYTRWAEFIFQAMFAATAATIVSGAVAERIKLYPFLLFSVVYVAIVYPVVGFWKWGEGWLHTLHERVAFVDAAFYDFAGSTLVHSVGGWAALAGVIVLGARTGKYGVQTKPIMGHNMPLATIGVFLLWFGWFGFNGGSVLSGDPAAVSYVFVTTMLAGCAGVVGAGLTAQVLLKTPDLSMTLNGALAGLVGITAGADVIPVHWAVLVGAIAGGLVVVSVVGLDLLKLDDPVGAISVHLVCGIWGTLAVGLFAEGMDIVAQLVGVLAVAAACFPAAFALFWIIRLTVGLRVSREEELRGLDLGEHDQEAYSGFQIYLTD